MPTPQDFDDLWLYLIYLQSAVIAVISLNLKLWQICEKFVNTGQILQKYNNLIHSVNKVRFLLI
ncbi:MAG: hypothetical protein EAZ77_02730 [Nostocales cyanobacterium]|nr:MAG: hypothetical protein EAZ77_02730 [Nostocales cyanobacterium]